VKNRGSPKLPVNQTAIFQLPPINLTLVKEIFELYKHATFLFNCSLDSSSRPSGYIAPCGKTGLSKIKKSCEIWQTDNQRLTVMGDL
jgi:hypothetical protein